MAENGSIIVGFLYMLIISILLFWVPLLGPLIAGIVGGSKAGGVGKGIVAAILPSLILAGAIFFLFSSIGIPVVGTILGGATTLIAVGDSIILVIGAIIGGIIA